MLRGRAGQMAYRFKLQEPLAQEVRRVALEQIDLAEEKLTSQDDIPDAIHNARRSLKRLRALIRLVRPAIGDAAYRRESDRVAGTARLLAGARDLHVMRLTATKLESRFGPLPNGAGKRLNALLAAEAAAIPSDAGKDGRAQALKRLKQMRKFFVGHALDDLAFAGLAEGLERCYRKGRRGFRDAFRKPSDESFHAWRKSVQRHWRHMQLISRAWPEALSARADEAKELSRLLGEDHDLAILFAKVTEADPDSLTREDVAAIGTLCRSCQTEIRVLAEPRGARLFAEPAEDLRRRIEAYWSSASRLAECTPEERPTASRKPSTAERRTRRRKAPAS